MCQSLVSGMTILFFYVPVQSGKIGSAAVKHSMRDNHSSFTGKAGFTIDHYIKMLNCWTEAEAKDECPSPDCRGNPFLKKKIAAESGKKLLKKTPDGRMKQRT